MAGRKSRAGGSLSRLTSLICAFVLAITLVPASALAIEDTDPVPDTSVTAPPDLTADDGLSDDAIEGEGEVTSTEGEELGDPSAPAAEEGEGEEIALTSEQLVTLAGWEDGIDVSWYNTTSTYFELSTPQQLAGLAAITTPIHGYMDESPKATDDSNAPGILFDTFAGKTVKLTTDLDLQDIHWLPISDANLYGLTSNFTGYQYRNMGWQGTFDGGGHVIRNLNVNADRVYTANFGGYQGFFSTIGTGGIIKNFGVEGRMYGRVVGGIVGTSTAGNYSNPKLSATEQPLIINCYADVQITGNGSGSRPSGGIFGGESQMVSIMNCYVRGSVSNGQSAGGIAGFVAGDVISNMNLAQIAQRSYIGAVVATHHRLHGTFSNNYALQGTCPNFYRWVTTGDAPTGDQVVTTGFSTESELKSQATLDGLGPAWVADPSNINNGYPVLFWQAGLAPIDINTAIIQTIPNRFYTGSAIEPTPTVSSASGTPLMYGRDYVYSYSDNTNIGTASVIVVGMGGYAGQAIRNFDITQLDLSQTSIDPLPNQWRYGAPVEPALTVRDSSGDVLSSDVYTIVYAGNNSNTDGLATATVQGDGLGVIGSQAITFGVYNVPDALSGSGTEIDPYLLQAGSDIQFLSLAIENKTAPETDKQPYNGAFYELTADIDGSGYGNSGMISTIGLTERFSGQIDGKGHTITVGLSSTTVSTFRAFAFISGAGSASASTPANLTIKNLTLDGTVSLSGSTDLFFGSFIGHALNCELVLENCVNKADITFGNTSGRVGGLIGIQEGTGSLFMEGCINEGSITADRAMYLGGLVGYLNVSYPNGPNIIRDCGNYSDLKTESPTYVGGIVAIIAGSSADNLVSRCFNEGALYGVSGGSGGGIVGSMSGGRIESCYNSGMISGGMNSVGGILGVTSTGLQVIDVYNTGSLSGSTRVSGLVGSRTSAGTVTIHGYNSGSVSSSSATANIDPFISFLYSSGAATLSGAYLDGCAPNTNRTVAGTMTDTTVALQETALKAYANTLGSAFTDDDTMNPLNNGFPVLDWQLNGLSTSIDIMGANIAPISNQAFSNASLLPEPVVTYGGNTLVRGIDYLVGYRSNINATRVDGPAQVIITGIGDFSGTKYATFDIDPQDISTGSIGTIAHQWVTDKPAEPYTMAVTSGGRTLVAGTDYSVAYADNTVAGTATATVTGQGNYTGTRSATYRVYEAAPLLVGTGTSDDPYLIASNLDLAFMAVKVNKAEEGYRTAAYKVAADFTVVSGQAVPQADAIGTTGNRFGGSLDGGGHTITLNLSGMADRGLFGFVQDASIENLIVDGSITGSPIAAFIYSTSGTVTIRNCTNLASVSSTASNSYVAGFVCTMTSAGTVNFVNCENAGTITAGTGTSCYAGGFYAGAGSGNIVREIDFVRCSNTGNVTSPGTYTGGFVGHVQGTPSAGGRYFVVKINNSFNTGTITGGNNGVGGLLGSVSSAQIEIRDSYNTGTLVVRPTANQSTYGTGGFIGRAATGSIVVFQNVYNACSMENNTAFSVPKGSFVGNIESNSSFASAVVANNSYWLDSVANSIVGLAVAHAVITDNSLAKTDSEMKTVGAAGIAELLGAAFADDTAIVNGGYPVLAARMDIAGFTIQDIYKQGYTGSALEPEVIVKDMGDEALVLGRDYLVSYANNTAVGTATVTITGIGHYTGVVAKTFEIVNPAPLTAASVVMPGRIVHTGSALSVVPVSVTVGSDTLVLGRDYTVSYLNGGGSPVSEVKDKGAYTAVLTGIGAYSGSASAPFTVVAFLSVYKQEGTRSPELVAEYTQAQLTAFSYYNESNTPVSGLYYNSGWRLSTASSYVELANLFGQAGLSAHYADGASVSYASGSNVRSATFAELEGGFFYPNTTSTAQDTSGGESVHAVLSLTEFSGSISSLGGSAKASELEADNITNANANNTPRMVFGVGEGQYLTQSAMGNRYVSNVDSITLIYPEPVYISVYEQSGTGTPVLLQAFTRSEFEALATTDTPISAQHKQGDSTAPWTVSTSTNYVRIDNLLAYLGTSLNAGDNVQFKAGSDGFAAIIPATSFSGASKFFPNASNGPSGYDTTDGINNPGIIAIEYKGIQVDGTTIITCGQAEANNLTGQSSLGCPRNFVGITEENFNDTFDNIRGARFTSGVDTVVIVRAGNTGVGAPGSGDLDGDGIVTLAEAMVVAQAVIGGVSFTPEQKAAMDMDGDGVLTMADVILIMRKAALL